MRITAEWVTETSYPEDWRGSRSPSPVAWVTQPSRPLQFSGNIRDLTMTFPAGEMEISVNLPWVERLLSSCFTRDDAGDWQACVPEESPDELRRIIEAGGVELEQSCYTCAVRRAAGAPTAQLSAQLVCASGAACRKVHEQATLRASWQRCNHGKLL